MKKVTLLFILILSLHFSKTYSQDFLGLSTGNYSGITGVSLQPASVVDSRFKLDINLFSTGVNYSNNYFLLDRDVLLKFNKNNFDDYATFKDRYLSQASLPAGERVFFNINTRTQLPLSFMATTGKKSGIALNMQFRTKIQGRGITQDVAELGFNNFAPSSNSTSIDASGIKINSLSWAEVGLTYGRVLYSSEKHFLKGAFTGKYLAGLSSISIASNDLRMGVNADSTFNFTSSNVSYNHNNNADFNELFDRNFDPSSTAFGFDAGLVYEYRGNIDKFKYLKSDDEKSYDALRRDVGKYNFRLGVSLLDVGMFRFDKPANVNSFSANINRWDIKNARYKTLNNFDTALAARVLANPNDPRSYNVYLPSALSAQLDIKFVKGLFLNVMSYWPVSVGSKSGKSFDRYGFYTITPRYESRHFGIYIPYTVSQRNAFTDYNQHLLGATLRLGPVFIGSSNLGSMLFNNNLRAADVHLGFKIGVTYGKPNKSNKFLNTVFDKNQQTEVNDPMDTYPTQNVKGNNERTIKDNKESKKSGERTESQLLLNYKDGNVYHIPDVKQNVVIINNNYYGNFPGQTNMRSQTKYDTVVTQGNTIYSNYFADSLQQQNLRIARQQNKIMADSIAKVATDSLKMKRTQLDSLIKSMQQLQIQMDSSNRVEDSINNARAYQNSSSMNRMLKTNDSLKFSNDSLREAATSRATTDTMQKDMATIYRQDDSDSSSFIKKKEKSEQGELVSRNAANARDTSKVFLNKDKRTTSAIKRRDQLQQDAELAKKESSKKDSSLFYSRSNDATDAAIKRNEELIKNNVAAQKKDNAAVVYSSADTRAMDRNQLAQIEANSKNLQLAKDKQNQLYNQYANQSARLQNDIDRLNRRVSDVRQNDTRNRVSYVPLPIQYNNSAPQRTSTVGVASTVVRDTIYIRDTINFSTKDTVTNIVKDTITKTIVKEVKPDTVVVQKMKEAPAYDYTAIPEQNILFGLGKSSVQPIYEKPLNFVAGILEKNPDLQVVVTGHTDATGSKAINQKLSLQRAEAVSYYLMNKGVSKNQIIIKSLSSEKPAVTGGTKAAQSQNRRVVVRLIKAGK